MTDSDGVRVHHEKKQWGKSSPYKKSDGVKVYYEKKRRGESSL